MTQLRDYAYVLKLAYDDDEFWRKLIARPAHALDQYGISLSIDDTEKLFSALRDFSLVLSFDKYRNLDPIYKNNPADPPAFDDSGWGCGSGTGRVPWGQT